MCYIISGFILALPTLAQALVAFTEVPAIITIGEPTVLEWSGGDGSAVTITLKKGDPSDLKTVNIITADADNGSFTWTPPQDLSLGGDYVFQINQGVRDVSVSGQFTLKNRSSRFQFEKRIFVDGTGPAVTALTSTVSSALFFSPLHPAPIIEVASSVSALSSISSFSSVTASVSSARSTVPAFTVLSGSITTIYITATVNSATISNTSITPKTTKPKIAVAVSVSIGVIVLIFFGFLIYRCRQRRKQFGQKPENEHIAEQIVINPTELSEPSRHQEYELSGDQEYDLPGDQEYELSAHQQYELSAHQEYELSTGAKNLRPELPERVTLRENHDFRSTMSIDVYRRYCKRPFHRVDRGFFTR